MRTYANSSHHAFDVALPLSWAINQATCRIIDYFLTGATKKDLSAFDHPDEARAEPSAASLAGTNWQVMSFLARLHERVLNCLPVLFYSLMQKRVTPLASTRHSTYQSIAWRKAK